MLVKPNLPGLHAWLGPKMLRGPKPLQLKMYILLNRSIHKWNINDNKTSFDWYEWLFILWWTPGSSLATKFIIYSIPLYHATACFGVGSGRLSIWQLHAEKPAQCCIFRLMQWPIHCWQCFPKQHPRRLCREEAVPPLFKLRTCL